MPCRVPGTGSLARRSARTECRRPTGRPAGSASSGGPESLEDPPPWPPTTAATATATAATTAATAPAAAAAAAQEDDAVGHDVRRVVLLAVLVVGPGLQPALDVDRPALGQVLVAVLGLVAPDGHAVPLRLLLPLARLVLEHSVVAMRRLQSGRLDGVYFSSGSAPRFPTRMTLFTLPMASPSITLGSESSGPKIVDLVGRVATVALV